MTSLHSQRFLTCCVASFLTLWFFKWFSDLETANNFRELMGKGIQLFSPLLVLCTAFRELGGGLVDPVDFLCDFHCDNGAVADMFVHFLDTA